MPELRCCLSCNISHVARLLHVRVVRLSVSEGCEVARVARVHIVARLPGCARTSECQVVRIVGVTRGARVAKFARVAKVARIVRLFRYGNVCVIADIQRSFTTPTF